MDYSISSKSTSRATSIHSRSSPRAKNRTSEKSESTRICIPVPPDPPPQQENVSPSISTRSAHSRQNLWDSTIAVIPPPNPHKCGRNISHGNSSNSPNVDPENLAMAQTSFGARATSMSIALRVWNCLTLTLVDRVIDDRVPLWGWYSYSEPFIYKSLLAAFAGIRIRGNKSNKDAILVRLFAGCLIVENLLFGGIDRYTNTPLRPISTS